MNEHEKWLSRRKYHEKFSTPGTAFPNWPGEPNRCNCGCAGIWYDRLSPTNSWTSFNPARYMSIMRVLFRVFLALHRVLWRLPPMMWIWLKMARTGYMREVRNRVQPDTSTSATMTTARLFWYGIIVPMAVIVWAAAWILSRSGIVLLLALFFPALVAATLLSILSLAAAIAISMRGLVFVLGGVGSIIYLDNPAIGIAFIVLGVLVQYEQQRRDSRRREEQLGYLILTLRPEPQMDP